MTYKYSYHISRVRRLEFSLATRDRPCPQGRPTPTNVRVCPHRMLSLMSTVSTSARKVTTKNDSWNNSYCLICTFDHILVSSVECIECRILGKFSRLCIYYHLWWASKEHTLFASPFWVDSQGRDTMYESAAPAHLKRNHLSDNRTLNTRIFLPVWARHKGSEVA